MSDSQQISSEIDYQAILNRIAQGELTGKIAAELGVGKGALRWRLAKLPDYQQAIIEQAESMVERATSDLMDDEITLPDAAIIARARARVDAAHKWAAARDPARWGPRQQVQVEVVDRAAMILQARERLIGSGCTAQVLNNEAVTDKSDVSD